MRIARWSGLVCLLLLMLFEGVARPATLAEAQSAQMTLTPNSSPQNSDLEIALAGFQARESIAIWLTLPNGRVVPINEIVVAMNPEQYEARADKNGATVVSAFIDWSFATGTYAVSARGNLSGKEVSALFELTPVPEAAIDERVALELTYRQGSTGSVLRVEGVGFVRDELVAMWATRADNSVIDLGLVRAEEGAVVAEIAAATLGEPGHYRLTVEGTRSARRGVLPFTLQ
jgi:hypothetical protein